MDAPHFHTHLVNFHPYTEELLNYPLDCSTQAIINMPIWTALYTMLSDSVQVCILHIMLLHNAIIACVLLSSFCSSAVNWRKQPPLEAAQRAVKDAFSDCGKLPLQEKLFILQPM